MVTVSKAVGIDLGTTNSAVAILNPTDTDIVIHRDAIAKAETTPSCVWKDPKSGELIVGRKAFRRIGTAPAPIRSVKRYMGHQTAVRLTDEDVTPEYVSSVILREMKRQIEDDVAGFSHADTKWIVDRAIITVPAYFDQPSIDATRKAGEAAGLQVLDLLHEPTAAACYHCWRTGTQDGVFLVYDLGGGTFDVTVLRCTHGTFEVLGISGNNRLGGDDLDTALAEHLRERLIREDWALELDLKNDAEDRLRFDKLKFLAESVKKALSNAPEFLLRDTGTLQDKAGNAVVIETMFERPELEAVLRPIAERTIPYCREALERAEAKAGVKLSEVDQIILAGGSTHVPFVRDMVRAAFCADSSAGEPRAKCAEPVYEKVDTIVALGAAIRAAAVGGLAVYNDPPTVRVSFRGTATTGANRTHIGGRVEPLTADVDLKGGRVRLIGHDFEDDTDLTDTGAFGFKEVPLQTGAENLLTFEIYDVGGGLVATAGRAVQQSREAGARPVGGGGSTAVLSKAFLLEVQRGGKSALKELIPSLATLPTEAEYALIHPGNTELVRLPIYQQKRRIQEIRVAVPSTLPRGTPINLKVHVDRLSFITVKGSIGDTTFEAAVEPPPHRKIPAAEEQLALEKAFKEAITYLPAGKKNVAEVKWRKAKQSFEVAVKRGDEDQAVHEFEEMEELVATLARTDGTLEPPKAEFDALVKECFELNEYVAKTAAEKGQPHDHREMARAIEAQREQGEKAVRDADQRIYGDVFVMLENIRNHLVGLYQKLATPKDDRTDEEKASGAVKHGQEEAKKIGSMAASKGRSDLSKEIAELQQKLAELAREAQKNPRGVREKVGQILGRLEQLKNMMLGRSVREGEGDLVIEQ